MVHSIGAGRPHLALVLAAAVLTALVLGPSPARAGLTSVGNATFEDLDTSTVIFSGPAAVVDPGVEFTGLFGSSTWALDLVDLGFTLTGTCSNDQLGCNFFGARLTLTGLVFSPPATLGALLGISGDLAAVAGAPVVTPSSVTITFGDFTLGTGAPLTQSYSARFDLQPVSAVPVPATLLLVLAGGVGVGLLSRRGRR